MARDPNKLKVFGLADDLVLLVYRCTKAFPPEERYGELIRATQGLIASLRAPKSEV